MTVDLPIKRISTHARREKSIRHGHISTLHIWWARRPLAACRAVILAALWPDPADPGCPQRFRNEARKALLGARNTAVNVPSGLSVPAYDKDLATDADVRAGLLDFIAEFANWDNSTNPDYLAFARHLVQVAHETLGGEPGTRPLVVDPFAGGGSIPLEALRVGADAFASDLNPVAVLLNKVVLEYIPKYGQRLADEVRKWGAWVKEKAENELREFYPNDSDGASPIAYLWARTIRCEGPGCGVVIPLIKSLWLAKKGAESVALSLIPDHECKRIDVGILRGAEIKGNCEGTVKRGSVSCPLCHFTTPVASTRKQLKARRGGTSDARLLCVVTSKIGQSGRSYRLPSEADLAAVERAGAELTKQVSEHRGQLSLIPDERISLNEIRRISAPLYGMTVWGDLFTSRQLLTLSTLSRWVNAARDELVAEKKIDLANGVQACLSLAVDRLADRGSSLCRWDPTPAASGIINTFSRQAIPMMWDFAEGNPLEQKSGGWQPTLEWITLVIEYEFNMEMKSSVEQVTATKLPLPDDCAHAVITDPPYYDAVPYAHLSDFFYVWLRRKLAPTFPRLFQYEQVPKSDEIVVDRPHELSDSKKDIQFYERELSRAFADACRVARPDGLGTIVFASKTTSSWEAILNAIINAGWIITASWPIDTEMESRVAAQGQARLASSVHLVCRPRENPDGSLRTTDIGDWRDVLDELPARIREWMLRLDAESVSGADAIFACLGPALEIFSRYSRVERADGTPVTLREYLEQVWAAVAKEALGLVFQGGDASGLEADARLTAMWLWTLRASSNEQPAVMDNDERADGPADDEDNETPAAKSAKGGFSLEFDAARKIAQGLGAHLESLGAVVEVKGQAARLLPVAERARHLFDGAGAGSSAAGPTATDPTAAKTAKGKKGRKPARNQPGFGEAEDGGFTAQPGAVAAPDGATVGDLGGDLAYSPGATTLDRVHQAMLMFGRGRSESLARFLKEDGAGSDPRFWRLAQSLSALYPTGTDEKRWVDGVLARKKGLGF